MSDRNRVKTDLELPGWVPPVVFGVLTVALFRAFVFSDEMLYGGDTLALGYAARALYADALATLGRVPGWAPHLLGGTPFLEALSGGDSLYPPSLLLLLLTAPHRALGWKIVLHVFVAGFFFFGWVRAIGGSKVAALLGGVAYMLAPFLVGFVHPGHDGKIFVTALAPLMFWVTERHFRSPGLASFAAIGLVVAGIIYTTHFQMAYFLFGGVGLYAIFRAIQTARGADEVTPCLDRRAGGVRFVLFLAASIAGAAGAAWQLVPAAEYVTEYSRRIQTTEMASGQTGRAWSSSFSMNPEEVMSLVVPEFAGNFAGGGVAWATGTYWGRNGFKDNHEYAGIVILLLAGVSFLGAARRQLRLFMTGLGTLALLFALGANTPVWGIFYELVPGIRLFRAPGMASFLFGFAAITMGALGLDRIALLVREGDHEELDRIQKLLWRATAGLGVLALLMVSGVFTNIWTSSVYSDIGERQLQVLESHLPNIAQGALIAVLLSAALAGLVWGVRKHKLPLATGLGLIVALAAADSFRVDQPFVQTMDFYPWSQADGNIRTILERERDGEPYRLWSLARGDQDVSAAIHGIELAAGHHPNDLSRYRELIGMVGSGQAVNLGNPNVRRILNVKYLLWPDLERGPAPQGPVVSQTQLADGRTFQTLFSDVGLPRARLVGSAVVKSDTDAVPYILSEEHDPSAEVVLATEPRVSLGAAPVSGTVEWITREPDRMTLSVTSEQPAILVVADNWFPAWQATIDGEATEVLRAYHTLRAIEVPPGVSTIEMWYEAPLLNQSRTLSLLVLLGLIASGSLGLVRSRRHSRTDVAGATGNVDGPKGPEPTATS